MSGFSQYPLQQAVFQTLTNDNILMAEITGIFDRVPESSAYPYVTLGDFSIQDWSTKTSNGTQQTLTFHVWSRDGGRTQAATVMERLYILLHEASLTVSGQTLVLMRFLSSSITLGNDGWTYQGIIKFHALLEATS